MPPCQRPMSMSTCDGTDLFTDDHEHVDELVAAYKRHGFDVIGPCVPTVLAEALLDKITWLASTLPDNRGDGRVCLNCDQNIFVKQWFDVLAWLVNEQSPTTKVMNHMFGDAWWFDICGGDFVGTQDLLVRACRILIGRPAISEELGSPSAHLVPNLPSSLDMWGTHHSTLKLNKTFNFLNKVFKNRAEYVCRIFVKSLKILRNYKNFTMIVV